MNRDFKFVRRALMSIVLMLGVTLSGFVHAEDEAPDVLVKRLSVDVLEKIKSDKVIRSGDTAKLMVLVDTLVMPNVDFLRLTSSVIGPGWRNATPEQQKKLQEEFKTLIVTTYAGALAQVTDQTIAMKPLRASAEDKEVIVRSLIKGRGDPISLDYRLQKSPGDGAGWKIYDINISGAWLSQTFYGQYQPIISKSNLDGLLVYMTEQNKKNKKKG